MNFAVDRAALIEPRRHAARGAPHRPVPAVEHPGFRDARDLPARAGRISRGRGARPRATRGAGKPSSRRSTLPPARARAGIVKHQLEEIGLDVEVRAYPPGATSAGSPRRGAIRHRLPPWSRTTSTRTPYINVLFDATVSAGQRRPFDSTRYNALMRRPPGCVGRALPARTPSSSPAVARRCTDRAANGVTASRRSSRSASAASSCAPRSTWPRSASSSALGRLHRHPDEAAATASPAGALPISIVFATSFVAGSMREGMPSVLATQTAPARRRWPSARPHGDRRVAARAGRSV